MAKTRWQLTIDEDLSTAFRKLPREVSVSQVVNLMLRLALEEMKLGREMTDKELKEWFRKSPKRLKVQMYMREKLGPYIDTIDETIAKFKGKVDKKK